MQCENAYCIYQENGACVLEKISLNALGQCEDCVLMTIDENKLTEIKKKQRDEE